MRTHAYDLTFLHQSLFFAFDTLPLRCDICLNGSFFGEHISPSLFLVAPFTQWFRWDELVFLLQISIVLGPLLALLYLGPSSKFKTSLGLILVLLLCNRSLRNTLIWDFREDHLAFGFLVLAWLSLYRQRYTAFLLLNLGAIGCKENIFIIVLASIPTLLYAKPLLVPDPIRKRLALQLALLSSIWGVLTFAHFIPSWNVGVEDQNNIVLRFSHFGSTPQEVLITLLTSPSAWWSLIQEKVLHPDALKYLFLLFGPYAYFFFTQPGWIWWMVPILPGLAMNLLSGANTQIMMQFHYDLILLPFLILGLVFGIRHRGQLPTWALIVALGLSGRWMGYDLWRDLPNLKGSQVSFLRSIESEGPPLAAPLSQMAWLSHVRNLRELRTPQGLPPKDSSHALKGWTNKNSVDRTALEGRGAVFAQRVLLNLKEPWHAWARKNLYSEWSETSTFESWVVLEKEK